MLNSAQHARSAASRLNDVTDRRALEQAREGLGGRDMEEAAHLGSEPPKEHFRGERAGSRSPRNWHGGNGTARNPNALILLSPMKQPGAIDSQLI
jgi:hypothetical protein